MKSIPVYGSVKVLKFRNSSCNVSSIVFTYSVCYISLGCQHCEIRSCCHWSLHAFTFKYNSTFLAVFLHEIHIYSHHLLLWFWPPVFDPCDFVWSLLLVVRYTCYCKLMHEDPNYKTILTLCSSCISYLSTAFKYVCHLRTMASKSSLFPNLLTASLPPAIYWLRTGLVSARSLICHVQGNTFGKFELLQDLAESKMRPFFTADDWVLKRIWNKGHFSVPSNSFQIEAIGRLQWFQR